MMWQALTTLFADGIISDYSFNLTYAIIRPFTIVKFAERIY